MNIYKAMKKAGVEIDHHEGDLYVPASPAALKIVADYKWRCNVTEFTSAKDGTRWLDIPFAYSPHYQGK